MPVLPRRPVRDAEPSARGARWAGAAFAGAFAAVMAADANGGAAAQTQGRLEAEYTVTVSGIPIGRGNWVIEVSDDQFTAAASGATTGLLRFVANAHGTSASRGTFNGAQPVPTSYAATIINDRKIDDVRMALAGGDVKDYSVEPPPSPQSDRIPVTDADRRGVLDPMSSTLNRVGGSGELISPEACNRKVAVFDGRMRYELRNEFKRIEMVKAERGYQGPAVVCAVYFTPVAGYVPDRAAIKYLTAVRDAEVYFVPILGTRVLVPFRFSMPTPIGYGVLQATQFVSVAQPAHANTTAKVQ
jgi:hypothetical protein